jgi:hypothetical protein
LKLFVCQSCGNVLYFENRACERCGHRVGFLPEQETMSAIEPDGEAWATLADSGRGRMLCRNAEYDACNWLTDTDDSTGYCRACRHNGTVPNLSDPAQLAGWRELEAAAPDPSGRSRARVDVQFPRRRSQQRAQGHDRS